MEAISILGYVAACCTTFSFVPQVLSIIKTKDTKSISLGMYIIFALGIFLWIIYGMLKADIPLLAANLITFLLSSVILLLKIRDMLKT